MDPQTPPAAPDLASQSTSPIQPKRRRHKMLLLFAILIVLLLLSGGMYFLGLNSQQIVAPSPSPESSPVSQVDEMSGWESYTINSADLTFKYPPNLEAEQLTDSGYDSDESHWVALGGSDQIYLFLYMYKSTKTPSDWWNSEGKNMFENLADETEKLIPNSQSINLTYETKSTTLSGKEALEVVVTSDYETPNTPKENNLTIFQNNGYIILTKYHEFLGTVPTSVKISDQILSTFEFTDSIDLSTAKQACMTLAGSKAWDDIHEECNEGSTSKQEMQSFCAKYNGQFQDGVSTCRYATGPCGPTATFVCSLTK